MSKYSPLSESILAVIPHKSGWYNMLTDPQLKSSARGARLPDGQGSAFREKDVGQVG